MPKNLDARLASLEKRAARFVKRNKAEKPVSHSSCQCEPSPYTDIQAFRRAIADACGHPEYATATEDHGDHFVVNYTAPDGRQFKIKVSPLAETSPKDTP